MSGVSKALVQAFAEALSGSIKDHGFLRSEKGFLDQLQSCIPWFDAFQRKIEHILCSRIDDQAILVSGPASRTLNIVAELNTQSYYAEINTPKFSEEDNLTKGMADSYLRRRCQACFGRRQWGGHPER
jgi:hypothetical protein